MNGVREQQKFPEILEYCNISSIFKGKGKRNSLENYRGIFRVTLFRNILDRLIYNDGYGNIEEGLTDSNVGARKSRNIRDNIFVLSAILNDVINGNDVAKCFDALWLEEAVSGLYESGLTNDKLSLLYLENELCKVAVKTPARLSRRLEIPRIVLQGTTGYCIW